MPCRAVVVLAAVAVSCVLASCGVTDIPSPRRTVTVTVDAPSAGSSGTSAATPTPVPTASAASVTIPTALAAGPQRGAPKSFDEAKRRIDAAKPAAGVARPVPEPQRQHRVPAQHRLQRCRVRGRAGTRSPRPCPRSAGREDPKDIGRIELGSSGAVPVCNSDTIRLGSEPKLGYGARTEPSGTTACLSEEFGVTCIDEAGRHGFFLARDTFVTF